MYVIIPHKFEPRYFNITDELITTLEQTPKGYQLDLTVNGKEKITLANFLSKVQAKEELLKLNIFISKKLDNSIFKLSEPSSIKLTFKEGKIKETVLISAEYSTSKFIGKSTDYISDEPIIIKNCQSELEAKIFIKNLKQALINNTDTVLNRCLQRTNGLRL